jgi:hypothetical protein
MTAWLLKPLLGIFIAKGTAMTVLEAYDQAISAYGNLVAKLGVYAEASSYDGKKDFGKWLAALDKATKEVEAAYADSKAKTATLEKTLDDYLKANRDKIKDDKDKKEAVQAVDDAIRTMTEGLKEIRNHLDQYKT